MKQVARRTRLILMIGNLAEIRTESFLRYDPQRLPRFRVN
jgi:hypothetical protein